jgi:hypothetical protein
MKTNIDKLVKQSVQGTIRHPLFVSYRVDTDGNVHVIPATGGITYNVKIGDPAFGWVGDHVEPGVSLCHSDTATSGGLNVFSCIGNEARVVTGDAKGRKGFVTGTHGGVEHVLVYFDDETLDLLTLDDKIMVKCHGQGLALTDYPNIKVMSIDPNLFEKLGIEEVDGKIIVPVTHKIPQRFMGSGVGAPYSQKGDYDILTSDTEAVKALGIDQLRFGDIVLLEDSDNSYGLGAMKKGATTIGVIIHSDCIKSGHGPGVTVIMSSSEGLIEGKIDSKANIANYLL